MPPRSSSRPAPVPVVKREPVKPGWLSLPAPSWTRVAISVFGAFLLFALFTSESGDPDTWWHLKTGQYVVQQHKLPVPDQFAWTTDLHPEAYPGERMTRRFNLTHEWLSQAVMYASYAALGFKGLISLRALWLIAYCLLVGLVTYERTHSFYRSFAVSFATVTVLRNFIADRPQYFTYVFLVLTILILENRKRLWLLPPLFVIWANCHAGFAMGWVAMGAYCGESLFYRFILRKPQTDERRLWTMCLGAIAVSGLNPNFFNVIPVLRYYRESPMQSAIWEWQKPNYWELSPFTTLMYSTIALVVARWRKTRPVDWILLVVFTVSALLATRNIFLVGIWGPMLLATYAPSWEDRKREIVAWLVVAGLSIAAYKHLMAFFSLFTVALIALALGLAITRKYPIVLTAIIALLLANGVRFQIENRYGFQFRGAMWKYPEAATDFILKNKLQGRIFNTYGQGGYLIWRLWPQQQVFLDGRALNEKVNADANRIAMNATADNKSKSGEDLLREYGIDIIMMDGFDPIGGGAYYLPAALADPSQKEWKLVYQDIHNVIYMRNPPPGLPVLKSLDALTAIEQQCMFWVEHTQPLCSRGMVDIFGRIGDRERHKKWMAIYNENRGAEATFTVVKK